MLIFIIWDVFFLLLFMNMMMHECNKKKKNRGKYSQQHFQVCLCCIVEARLHLVGIYILMSKEARRFIPS